MDEANATDVQRHTMDSSHVQIVVPTWDGSLRMIFAREKATLAFQGNDHLLILQRKHRNSKSDCYHQIGRANLFLICPLTAPLAFMCKHSSWGPNFLQKCSSPVWARKSKWSNVSNSTNIARNVKECKISRYYLATLYHRRMQHIFGAYDSSYHTSKQ